MPVKILTRRRLPLRGTGTRGRRPSGSRRSPGRVQELPAQPLDVAVDGAVADVGVVGVALLHELLARLDVAGMAHERVQHHELRDGERHGRAVPARGVALQVELERAAAEDLVVVPVFGAARAGARLEERDGGAARCTRATSSRIENGLQR